MKFYKETLLFNLHWDHLTVTRHLKEAIDFDKSAEFGVTVAQVKLIRVEV